MKLDLIVCITINHKIYRNTYRNCISKQTYSRGRAQICGRYPSSMMNRVGSSFSSLSPFWRGGKGEDLRLAPFHRWRSTTTTSSEQHHYACAAPHTVAFRQSTRTPLPLPNARTPSPSLPSISSFRFRQFSSTGWEALKRTGWWWWWHSDFGPVDQQYTQTDRQTFEAS